eukprot:CAMPEP_0117430296 /NCGR_PEP_ID=MMETSP0758-20121206/9822_1 /TAXON_ID=63605 /ORGANISM="Percolomonas cosmopolitus, Strain AE-1 (ATCC 50343)" /LENGTH=138 /DNA_ID=CAMNT_0005218147 /DNA_START=54 /DNA_END=467 /DNA_ORIENTATION=+
MSKGENVEIWRETMVKEQRAKKEWQLIYGDKFSKDETTSEARARAQRKVVERRKESKKQTKELKEAPERFMLYSGLSHEGGGRTSYLQNRTSKPLPERMNNPSTTGQEIGWKLEKNEKEHKVPLHGRKGILKRDFYAQ